MKKCARCGTITGDDSQVCGVCGASLQEIASASLVRAEEHGTRSSHLRCEIKVIGSTIMVSVAGVVAIGIVAFAITGPLGILLLVVGLASILGWIGYSISGSSPRPGSDISVHQPPRGGSVEAAGFYAGLEAAGVVLRHRDEEKSPKLTVEEFTVNDLLQSIIGPLTYLEDQLNTAGATHALHELLKALSKHRKFLIEDKPRLQQLAPNIVPRLYQIVDPINQTTSGGWDADSKIDAFLADPTFGPLISWLRYGINQWIIEHSGDRS